MYLRHGYIPAPYTVYDGFFKLPPASILSIPLQDVKQFLNTPRKLLEKSESFWRLTNAKEKVSDKIDAQEKFEQSLIEVVKREMRSDVPLGAFLSGG